MWSQLRSKVALAFSPVFDILGCPHAEVKVIMLTIIVCPAGIWHAIASVSACTVITVDLAVLTLLIAALLSSNRQTDLIPATSELVINKAWIWSTTNVVGIDLLTLAIIKAAIWERITKVIVAADSKSPSKATLSGVHLVVELITITDITNISGFNCNSILGSSPSCLLLFHWIFSESNFFGNNYVTLDLEVAVLISWCAALTVSLFCSSHSWFFIAIQLNIWLQVESKCSAHFDISTGNGSSTEERISSNSRSANKWDKRTSQIVCSAASGSSEATNSEALIILSISSEAAPSKSSIVWWRSRARWRKVCSSQRLLTSCSYNWNWGWCNKSLVNSLLFWSIVEILTRIHSISEI